MALGGRWLTMQGERCAVYVAETATGEYFTWCDDPVERSVKAYGDPRQAILAGLQRAAGPGAAAPTKPDRARRDHRASHND